MSTFLQFNHAVVPQLPSYTGNKHSHIYLLLWAATASDGLMPSLDQLKHDIMSELTGYPSYENSQLYPGLGSAPLFSVLKPTQRLRHLFLYISS